MIAARKIAPLVDASPTLTVDQIRHTLQVTARKFPVTPDKPIGPGIVDAFWAVCWVTGNGCPTVK
jgi:hypothetical protein